MSYTPPTYVDTKAQAILALASVVADEDKTALGDGSVNKALDVLADVLAESDVSVPQTNAGAILALAQYIGGGGGGGGSIKFVPVPYYTDTEPVVGGYATESVLYPGGNATSMIVDGLEILNDSNSSSFLYFIAGSTVTQYATSDTFVGIYTVTIGEDDLHGDPVFKTVTAWSSDDYTIDDENEGVTYTYPDLAENEYVVLYVSSIGR